MDLLSFTKKKHTKIIIKNKIILDNKNIKIEKLDNKKIKVRIRNKKTLYKLSNILFFSPTTFEIIKDKKNLEIFFNKSIDANVEGVMIKNLNSKYIPGQRTGNMGKLKETKEEIDVVILGAEHGKGKRAGFYSSFLVGVKSSNPNDENFYSIGKVSSGIKEKMQETSLQTLNKLLKPLKVRTEKNIDYFEPKIILQIKYQEIQKSTTYSSGFALRFPRIVMLRTDKGIQEINSIKDIWNLI